MPIPPDTRAAGDPGHVADHNAIADVLTALTSAANPTVTVISSASGTVNLDPSARALQVTQTANCTFTFTPSGTLTSGVSYAFEVYLTPGTFTTAWPGSVTWLGGTAPTLSTGLNALLFETLNGGTTWYASLVTGAPNLPLSISNGGTGLASAGVAGTFLASTGTSSAGTYTGLLPPAATVQTGNFTATLGQLNEADATAGSITATLPAGAFGGQFAAVKMIATASSHTVTVQATAPDILGRTAGWTSGSYPTATTPYALTGQGQLFTYGPPVSQAATVTSGNASISISTSTAPFATGQLVFFTATTAPAGLTAATPYYVVATTGPTGGTFTFQVSATAGGTAITPSSAGSAVIAATCGNWTVVADDLPLSQLDARYQNQNTTGKSASADALNSATTVVNVASATAPSSGQVLTATSGTAATWQAASGGFSNPMTTLGDLLYENGTPAAARLAGNTTATKNYLTQTGNGTISAAPAWAAIAAADLPAGTTSAKGALQLDGTASDIAAAGATAAAGSTGKAADAGHVHAGLALLAATSLSGYAKVNGTGNILTWTAPNDGVMHRVMLMAVERITSTETGGTVTVTPGFPDGTTATAKTLFTAGQATGYEYSANASCPVMFLLGPNTTITVAQQSALTAGASTVWVELWGS